MTDGSNAPGPRGGATSFRITHPFHPLFDRELDLVGRRANFGRLHVYYHDDRERLRSVPLEWTDLAAPDPFLAVSAGRSQFRPVDLRRLAELIAGLRGDGGGGGADGV